MPVTESFMESAIVCHLILPLTAVNRHSDQEPEVGSQL